MGNQCKEYFSTPDQELITALGDEDNDPSIHELKLLLLKKIYNKNDDLVIKNITNEEFDDQLII